jgi:hypothetical protein
LKKSLLIVKEIINTMRTTIPAAKKDVAKAKSCTLKGSSTIWNKSPAKYIDITKQNAEIIAAAVSTFNGRPPA